MFVLTVLKCNRLCSLIALDDFTKENQSLTQFPSSEKMLEHRIDVGTIVFFSYSFLLVSLFFLHVSKMFVNGCSNQVCDAIQKVLDQCNSRKDDVDHKTKRLNVFTVRDRLRRLRTWGSVDYYMCQQNVPKPHICFGFCPPLRPRHLELETRKVCKTHLYLQHFQLRKKFCT